jgi:hypothetical protein
MLQDQPQARPFPRSPSVRKIEIHYIELLVFTLLALMAVVAGPLLHFFFKEFPTA